MGYAAEKIYLILNRYPSQTNAVHKELEKSFGFPILQRILNENYPAIISSINKGEPFTSVAPESNFRKSILDLSTGFNGHVDEALSSEDEALSSEIVKPSGFLKKLVKR